MKKSLLGLTFASLMFSAGSAVAADYKIDKEGQHAFVNFRIQHLGYSWLYGTFKDFDGTFTFDEKNPAADKVNVTINTTSVDTNHAERDKHLRSADFLNTAKYPQATFTSTGCRAAGTFKGAGPRPAGESLRQRFVKLAYSRPLCFVWYGFKVCAICGFSSTRTAVTNCISISSTLSPRMIRGDKVAVVN